jgi:hypothetical protein
MKIYFAVLAFIGAFAFLVLFIADRERKAGGKGFPISSSGRIRRLNLISLSTHNLGYALLMSRLRSSLH